MVLNQLSYIGFSEEEIILFGLNGQNEPEVIDNMSLVQKYRFYQSPFILTLNKFGILTIFCVVNNKIT